MSFTSEQVTRVATQEAASVLTQCLGRIAHCCGQLNDEQIWWRPHGSMNSIGNLLLHLAGNVRQWIICGVGEEVDARERQAEFDADGPIPFASLQEELERTVTLAIETLGAVDANELMVKRRVQEFDVTGWAAVWDSVAHFQGHTQEIICLTRLQLGEDYQYKWQPSDADSDSQGTH